MLLSLCQPVASARPVAGAGLDTVTSVQGQWNLHEGLALPPQHSSVERGWVGFMGNDWCPPGPPAGSWGQSPLTARDSSPKGSLRVPGAALSAQARLSRVYLLSPALAKFPRGRGSRPAPRQPGGRRVCVQAPRSPQTSWPRALGVQPQVGGSSLQGTGAGGAGSREPLGGSGAPGPRSPAPGRAAGFPQRAGPRACRPPSQLRQRPLFPPLVQVTAVPELSLTAVRLSHDGTGAQYLHLAREDRNNTFRCGRQLLPRLGALKLGGRAGADPPARRRAGP